jgi:hypothetical protein
MDNIKMAKYVVDIWNYVSSVYPDVQQCDPFTTVIMVQRELQSLLNSI